MLYSTLKKEGFLLVVCIAVFFGVVAPGSKPPWIQSINLHEELKERSKHQSLGHHKCHIQN